MGSRRIGLARIEALVENLKREVAFGAGTTLKDFRKQVVLSGGGTTTLTAADSGAFCIFDTAATSNFTLPAPKLGMHFTFIQTIINTADHVIQAATNDHGFIGGVMIMNTTADQTNAFATATDGNNDFITLNATTTGGAAAGFTFAPEYNGYRTTLAAIGGNGGGGGAGFPGGTGGQPGTQEAYSQRVYQDKETLQFITERYNDPTLFLGAINTPSAGGSGSNLIGGRDKAIAYQNGYKPLDYPASTSIIESFAKSPIYAFNSGHGGDIAQAGYAGGDGFSEWSFTALTKDSYNGANDSENGATAGAAGAAINTNGNTVTYLITGDIRGATI